MPEIGQSSHTEVEMECLDIPVDTERLIGYAPVAPTQSEIQEDEDVAVEVSEPVWGAVMRFEGDEDSDAEEETAEGAEEGSEEDPTEMDQQEGPQGAETAEYQDDMGTTADDIIEELTTQNADLEERVHELEEANQTHQEMEDRYRDVAYQRIEDVGDLRRQISLLQQDRVADHRHQTQLGQRWAQAEERADRFRAERDTVRTEVQVLRDELLRTRTDRDTYRSAWQVAVDRVRVMEEEVRTSAARVDSAGFALDTAFGRLRSRVRRYPREEDLWRRVISRRTVDRIARQEHRAAILRRGF